jgi:hypothetical protein
MTDAKTRAERVAEWRASGLSAVKFSAGRDFTAHRLWDWASKIRKVEEARTPGIARTTMGRMRLARVVRVPRLATEATAAGVGLTVEVFGARVGVPPGFDRATLAAVLDEIEARAGKR